jgi:hypothetical protein
MMAGCLLGALLYLPIYRGMVSAAGNNVVAVQSVPDPVTREPKLTPVTRAPDGSLVRAAAATSPNRFALTALVFVQVVFVCMVYGPIAAYLVEAFPAKIRYTSLSLPYHIGNGVFGGLLPVIGLYLCAATGNIFAGLAYPIAIALLTFAIGTWKLQETRHIRIWDELHFHRHG